MQILQEDFLVFSPLKLKNKDKIVVGGMGKCLSFWNTITLKKEHTVECCSCWNFNGLIELSNHCVTVSGRKSYTIDVIDTEIYQLIKHIKCEGYIIGNSGYPPSLYLLSNGTFSYSHDGCFCQISSTTYDLLFTD